MKQLCSILCLMFPIVFAASAQDKSYPFDVKVTGHGKQAIIFIPGFSCSGDVWKETIAGFEDKYTCYVLTMSGFAGVKPQDNPTFLSWENGIADYIKDRKMDKPILVGHSMGGGLALAIAADYPKMIGSIIVVDALPCLAAIMDPTFKAKPVNDCTSSIHQMTSMTDEQFYQMQKRSMSRLVADTAMQALVVKWSVLSDRKTFGQMFCDFSNTDLRDKIKSVECPALILLESYFKNMKPAIEAQYSNLKTAQLQYADKGLHFIMYDDKDWYLKQLHDFIK